ncbi:MAG: RidA family protein [Alphaproteobacteria bacterium]
MPGRIDSRLKSLDITLPQAATAVGNYVPWVMTGSLVFVSGQITLWEGTLRHVGRVGESLTLDDGYQAARLCGLNIIAQVREACGGDLDRVRRVVRLAGFVNCVPGFEDHPKVLNGASDLMVEVFGDAGRHARAAVGASSLPRGVAVEIEAVVDIGPENVSAA